MFIFHHQFGNKGDSEKSASVPLPVWFADSLLAARQLIADR
jgi:hypothetical protein